MFNQVKKSLFSPFIAPMIAITMVISPLSLRAEDCDLPTMVRELKQSFGERFSRVTTNVEATAHGKRIKNARLDQDYAYMVEWKLKRDNQTGPWAMKGNTLIHGVKKEQKDVWMEKIGMKSFGLGFREHAWDVGDGLTGVLRIRNKTFPYWKIQNSTSFQELLSDTSAVPNNWTEATFMATDEELDAMLKFLEDRVENRITAVKKVGDIEKGSPLRPSFEITSSAIRKESCAGACSSMFHPDWLFHYGDPRAITLATMSIEKGLRNHSSAKAYVFSNFRNPNVSAITILGSDTKFATGKDFVEQANWGKIPGMMWGFIPDRPVNNPSPNYTTTRIPLKEWLRDHQ